MAQRETGLGWSAKEEWLTELTGTICTVAGMSGFPNQPIPKNITTVGDCLLHGFLVAEYVSSGQTHKIYAAAKGNYDIMISEHTSPALSMDFWSNVYGAEMLYVNYNVTADTYADQTFSITGAQGTLYRMGYQGYYSFWNPTIYIPSYATDQDAYNAINQGGATITKDNSGYAVVGLVYWNTSASTVISTPVLISSDREAVEMSSSDSSHNLAVATKIIDGVRFYMSYFDIAGKNLIGFVEEADLREYNPMSIDQVFGAVSGQIYSNILVTETVDPFKDFGNNGEDQGEVDPDPDDDEIEADPLPQISFADAGFARIYRPSLQQLRDLADYMWTDTTFLQTVINHLKQILENPINAIITLNLVPCSVDVYPDDEVKVMFIPTGVYMPPIVKQFVEVDCGTVTLQEMYGSALDYNPYTKVQIYLPYIGTVQLDTDEVMGKTLHVKYRIDVVTGLCCAYIDCSGDILYQFSGHCAISQPITSADFSGYINAAIAAGKLVASVAAAGAGAPEVGSSLLGLPAPHSQNAITKYTQTERNPATGRQITAWTDTTEKTVQSRGASFGEIASRGISNTVGSVMNSKLIIQHSGGFSGNSGYIAGVRRPYLIVTRPRIANPEKYGQYNGRPCMMYLTLGDCTGYTQVQSIQLTGVSATNTELSEIATLLMSGVII